MSVKDVSEAFYGISEGRYGISEGCYGVSEVFYGISELVIFNIFDLIFVFNNKNGVIDD